MNSATKAKVDGLLDLAIHEELGAEEIEELARLAEEDAAVAKQLRATLVVEAALRARGPAPDIAAKVVADLQRRDRRQGEQVLQAVMSQVRSRPKAGVVARPKPHRLMMASVAATATIALAATVAIVSRPKVRHPRRPAHVETRSEQSHTEQRENADGHPLRNERQTPPRSTLGTYPSTEPVQADVLHFDFEDGAIPGVFEQGQVVAAPAGDQSGYVIQGTFNVWAPGVSSVFANKGGGLFTYQSDLVLRFRYLLSPEAKDLRVQIFDIDQGQNYQWKHPNPTRSAWASVAVSLSMFYPVKDRSRILETGDRLQNIFVMGGPIDGAPLLLDDIVLARERFPSQPTLE